MKVSKLSFSVPNRSLTWRKKSYLSFGFNKGGLKAQWSTEPRASEATPWVSRVGAVAPWKGKSLKPLFCYSYLIAELAVLKWNIVCIFCSILAPCLKAFALLGRDCSNTRYPGCRFACPGLCAPLGLQPAFAKSESWVILELFYRTAIYL